MSEQLPIKGIRTLSLIDYPKKLSAVIFLGGCNFRCPYCHNMELVLESDKSENIGEDFILEELKRRKKFLDAVVLTGGEPALYPRIIPFAKKIREMGYLVKLDTNGYTPSIIKKIEEEQAVDFISMDIKTALDEKKYAKTAGVAVELSKIEQTIDYLMKGSIDYEFRTTVIEGFVSLDDVREIARRIKGCKSYFLQGANSELKQFPGPSPEILEELASQLRQEGIQVHYR